MGRKALDKERKDDPKKKVKWATQLIPFFQQRGLKGVTMDDVAAALNKSKATVYKYFGSREEIIATGIAIKLEEIQKFETYLKDKDLPYLERYKKAVQYLSEHIGDISNLFLADLKHELPDMWRMVEDFRKYTIEVLKGYYEEGIENGTFNDLHPALMVMGDQFFVNILSDPDFLIEHEMTIKEAFDEYFKMKFYGIMKD